MRRNVFLRYFGLLTLAAVLLGCADPGGEGDADGTDLQYEVDLPFTEAEISADPRLRTLLLRQ